MTNKEWLEYLANNAPDELAAWFDAEHTESPTSDTMQHIGQVIENTVKRGVYGDTDVQNADSRERLEADMRELMRNLYEIGYTDAKINHGILNDEVAAPLFSFDKKRGAKFIELLDRQAAITEHEVLCHPDERDEQIAEMQVQVDELKERADYSSHGWAKANIGWAEANAEAEKWRMKCDEYRSLFGKCIDYADAIHALMDEIDEGWS